MNIAKMYLFLKPTYMHVWLISWLFDSITVGYWRCFNRRCYVNRLCCVNLRCCFNHRSCKSRHLQFSSLSENIYVSVFQETVFMRQIKARTAAQLLLQASEW